MDTMALLGGETNPAGTYVNAGPGEPPPPHAPPSALADADAPDPEPSVAGTAAPDPSEQVGPGEEIDVILGYGDTMPLASGTVVHLRPLKSRELMAALRVILNGVGADTFNKLDPDAPTVELVGKFAALMMAGMLHATDEMIGFVRMMVEPANLPGGRLDKAQQARVDAAKAALAEEMDNPEPEDLVRIIAAVAQRDGADLAALGKLLAGVIRMFQRSGLIRSFRTSRG